jgi:murein L,D-transpeptidase YcbB/YkuD
MVRTSSRPCKRLLAGAAFAALATLSAPAVAATTPGAPVSFRMFGVSVDPGVNAFYAARNSAPLWLGAGQDGSGARELLSVLKRSGVEGFADGPEIAARSEALMVRASQTGDRNALLEADRLLSTGWVQYVQMLRRPPAGMTYAEQWIAPRQETSAETLRLASAAKSLDAYVRSVAAVNPIYSAIRDAAFAQSQATGIPVDSRVLTSLERTRGFPAKGRFVVVDAASAHLLMMQDGQAVDSMKVIVGKSDPSTQTPMLASVIHYATLNPYWHVTPDLVRSLIARNVLDQGLGYLRTHGYQVLSADDSGEILDPARIDWHAVADGSQLVKIRQLPGPANSMGRIKIGFPNSSDIYLHDTPNKDLFAQDDRTLSHGCIRLEDAGRLARWLMGRDPQTTSNTPEQNVLLPGPVPIYVTYLTARVEGGQLAFVDDPYRSTSAVAALR